MTSLWTDRTSLKKKIVEARKQHFLNCLMGKNLTAHESEEIIERIIHCNKILFELKMNEKMKISTKMNNITLEGREK
jgi:hypothetical protein